MVFSKRFSPNSLVGEELQSQKYWFCRILPRPQVAMVHTQYLNLFFDGSRHFNTWRCFLQIPLHDTGLWDHLFVAPKQHFLTCYNTIVPFNSYYHLCCLEAFNTKTSQELEKQTITRKDLTRPSGETKSEVITNLPSPFTGHVRMSSAPQNLALVMINVLYSSLTSQVAHWNDGPSGQQILASKVFPRWWYMVFHVHLLPPKRPPSSVLQLLGEIVLADLWQLQAARGRHSKCPFLSLSPSTEKKMMRMRKTQM